MSKSIVPPKFIDDPAEYAAYKKKLQRWARITKTVAKLQAETVLHYLEDHPSGIQEKVETALGDEIIDKEDGMVKLIAYLDTIYEEDEMINMWMKYKKFVRSKKADEQPISEFIAEFEMAYKEAKDNGCEVSDTVLALMLLESCQLSETDEKFVLTAVDFKTGKEQRNCLEQVKKSLRKFQSRDRMSSADKDRLQLKDEDTFVADLKDALLSDGWRPPPNQNQGASNSKDSSARQNSPVYKGRKNRLGADGKPLRCFHCDSEYHLTYDCDQKASSSSKEKKGANSKSKKNATEHTMLSTVLAEASKNKKYSMVCDVHDCSHVDDVSDILQKPMMLSDLLSGSTGTQFSLLCETNDGHVDDVPDVLQKPMMLSDLLSGSTATQFSLVCETNDGDQVCDMSREKPMVLSDLFSSSNENESAKTIGSIIENNDNDHIDLENTSAKSMMLSDLFSASTVLTIDDGIVKENMKVTDQYNILSKVSENASESATSYSSPIPLENGLINENENLVLVSHDEKKLCYLVEEAGCRGVLDSGCSKSVTGLEWIGSYTNAISPEFSKQLVLSPSSEVYQFGGGEKRTSRGSVSLPTLIGELRVFITMDVVDASIPLLIGTNSMKVGKVIMNFETNQATFFGEVVPMVEVGSGHFCINLVSENLLSHIDDEIERDQKVQDTLLATKDLQVSDIKKLHHYYGHTHPDKLLKFLKNAGKDTADLRAALVKIGSNCESCIRTKRRTPRPQCSIPRVEGPNEILTIDLKEWSIGGKKRYICYLIDMFSRLTSGSFIHNKNPDTIVDCILLHWVQHYGLMKGIHSDIGGEFSNSLLEDVAHRLGVELTTTASYSPHQNGLNERNHAVVDMMVTRMMASDKNLTPNIALVWAMNAKNSLENQYGYSPFQLHIGGNPVLPSATRDGPPSFESSSKSSSFVKHVNAMMSARKQFIRAESSTSLKKALKSRLHTRGNDIREGDRIYYKKNEGKGKNVLWKGPSKVTAVNGKKLFVDQGARLGTVNRDDAVRVGEEFWRMDELPEHRALEDVHKKSVRKNEKSASKKNKGERKGNTNRQLRSQRGGKGTRNVQRENKQKSGTEEVGSSSSTETSESEEEVSDEQVPSENEEENSEVQPDSEVEGVGEIEGEVDNTSQDEDADGTDTPTPTHSEHTSDEEGDTEAALNSETEYEDAAETQGASTVNAAETFSFENVQKGDVISYKIPESGVTETSIVIGRAGKVSGSNKYCWNIQVQSTKKKKSVNTEMLEELRKINSSQQTVSTTLVVVIPRYLHSEPECVMAKEKELKNWRDFEAFVEVEDVGQETINTNWVLVRKDTGIKARLCIRGDKEPNKDSIQTDSPTVNKVNIKLFYMLAASFGWKVSTADIRAAFLQGAEIDRDVFVRPPKECRMEGMIWKMVKRAYGFVDASRGFYIELDKSLLNLGCRVSRYDPALYMYFGVQDGLLNGMLLTHVDDFLHGSGTEEFHENVLCHLKERFEFGNEDDIEFVYVGMHVLQCGDSITVDQDRYVDNLEIPDVNTYTGIDDALLDEDGQADFRAAVGRIGWVANSTRPDMAYDNLVLSMKLGKATIRDMRQVCRIMKKMKCDGTQMRFVNLGPVTQWTLQGYGDAGFRSLPDRTSSCGGQVILLSNLEKGVSCVVDWKSKKLKRVVTSSTSAEALAANDTLDLMVYVQSVLTELLGEKGKCIPLVLATDSSNLHKAVMSSSLVENPRLRTDLAVLKESLQSRELNKLLHVVGRRMIADVLTKKGAPGFKLMNLLRTCKLSSNN